MRFVLLLLLIWPNLVFSADIYKIYLSATGDDNNDGLSNVSAIITLNRAQQILKINNPNTAVEIHIKQGLYLNQSVNWTYTNGHLITFTPINFSKARPVFDGNAKLNTWFTFKNTSGAPSHLKFRYIKVQNYNTGMSFQGNRNSVKKWNSDNELYGMYFYNIGGLYSDFDYSTAALRFVNSKNNSIVNSHFVNILNQPTKSAFIHAIYFAHYSSNNEVRGNRFQMINGDPIRTRDESNYNLILGNIFFKTGFSAYYSDWYCSAETTNKICTKKTGECPSVGFEFKNNNLFGGYKSDLENIKQFGVDDYCVVTQNS
ncbi:MAG: hypothetical protein HRU38_10680 [Saccharospirillaceae bacterium]|nr:hypothetical protein [Pseudomonadales bacterium]NRB79119.1 hypothetical protein [Saccharospirillaceae bacterium]